MATRILIHGAKGRMGRALLACAPQYADLEVVGQVDLGDDLATALPPADVVVDFSAPEATAALVAQCVAGRKAMVIGTTGHDQAALDRIRQAATTVPMVLASNFSTGVNTLFWLTRRAAEILGPDYDVEIVEMHHRLKKDAPSGTARTLAEILAAARRTELSAVARHGRSGLVGPRAAQEIGIHAVRGGDVVGDHTVIFAASGERVELTHRATNRETFAHGALRAARWVASRPPGLYDMGDVLGLK